MHKQAISMLKKVVKNDKPHTHAHDDKHLSLKDKILVDDLFLTLRNERNFMSLVWQFSSSSN